MQWPFGVAHRGKAIVLITLSIIPLSNSHNFPYSDILPMYNYSQTYARFYAHGVTSS